MNDIKEIIYNCLTKEEEIIRYTDEEQAEKDRIEQEEANKPKPPTLEQRVEGLELDTVTTAETVIDVDYRLTMIELGLN